MCDCDCDYVLDSVGLNIISFSVFKFIHIKNNGFIVIFFIVSDNMLCKLILL